MISEVSVIIPAGGRSERMGAANKLLLPLEGRTLLEHVVDAAQAAGPLEVIVVTGHERERVARVAGSRGARVIHNAEFEGGMGSTLRTGIAAASGDALGFAILPADLPFVRSQTIRELAERATPAWIVIPTYHGKRGHPVLFGRDFRRELLALGGDVGGRGIIQAHPEAVVLVETSDPGTLQDIDTRDDYDSVS